MDCYNDTDRAIIKEIRNICKYEVILDKIDIRIDGLFLFDWIDQNATGYWTNYDTDYHFNNMLMAKCIGSYGVAFEKEEDAIMLKLHI